MNDLGACTLLKPIGFFNQHFPMCLSSYFQRLHFGSLLHDALEDRDEFVTF